jgi:hypothetical protein
MSLQPKYCSMQLICSNCEEFRSPGKIASAYVVTRNKEYVSCGSDKCDEIIFESKKKWMDNYGSVEYLKNNTSLTVHRSDGSIENNWKIIYGGIDDGKIECTNADNSIRKWVRTSDLELWNPRKEV